MSAGGRAHLNAEQLAEAETRKAALRDDHESYLATHPEVKHLLNDFLADLLARRPVDVFAHAQQYFADMIRPRLDAAASASFLPRASAGPPRPLVICGPSGVGKGTLIERLLRDWPERFGFSVSHTTRGARPGEQDGVHYHFVPKDEMQQRMANAEFVETALVHGNYYGTSFAAIERVMKDGKICVLDIDVQGARQVKSAKMSVPPVFVFVRPPSMEELERRLRGRGTETEDKIKLRLQNSAKEIEVSREPGFFDHIIVNDQLDAAYDELKTIIFGPSS